MTEDPQGIKNSFNEKMRLIRFRRKKEKLRFWNEFKLVPRWLIWTVVVLYLIAQIIGQIVLHVQLAHHEQVFSPELDADPGAAGAALVGIITGVSLVFAIIIFMVGYVNQDAKRRTSIALIAGMTWSRRKPPNLGNCLARQAEPGPERGVLFVLAPRRTQRFAERSDAALENGLLDAKRLRGRCEQLFFSDARHRQVAARARNPQAIAKELAVGGVNQGVGGKDLFESGKRAAGRQEQSATHKFEVTLRQIHLQRTQRR